MFDRILSKVSIGSAEVDTRLGQTRLQPGDSFTAQVVVEGGKTDQEIGGLQLALQADIDEPSDDGPDTRTIQTWRVSEGFTIGEGEQEVIQVEGRIPHETPVTEVEAQTRTDVWIATDLDIDRAVDAEDIDYLRIEPTAVMEKTLRAIENAGYRLHEVETDPDRVRVADVTANLGLDQEFEFRPTGPNSVEQAEVHFLPRDEQTHVRCDFECDGRSDRSGTFTVDGDDSAENIAAQFRSLLDGGVAERRPTEYIERFEEGDLDRYYIHDEEASLASEQATHGTRSLELETSDGSVDVGTIQEPVPENGDTFQYRFFPTPIEGDGG
ncbi:MAG: sporulation protein, partial [Halobaculum sp.]